MSIRWVGFITFVLLMLAVDLGFHQKPGEPKMKSALLWSAFWIGLSVLFGVGIWVFTGSAAGTAYFAGYLLEKSLSVDNLFVFLAIFSYFKVPARYQHKVLFWGILCAMVLRALFIFTGAALVQRFHWLFYVFGAFLVFTAVRMVTSQDKKIEPDKNPLVRFLRAHLPLSNNFGEGHFFRRKDGELTASLLVLVLVVIECTDVLFAADSIPAVLAITTDPFLVFTSNIMAILGLRALYFVLAEAMRSFQFLKYGVAAILGFVGVKMLLNDVFKISTIVSLTVIATALIVSMAASYFKRHDQCTPP